MAKSFVVIKNHSKVVGRAASKEAATAMAVLKLAKHPGATYEIAKVNKRIWVDTIPGTKVPREEDT